MSNIKQHTGSTLIEILVTVAIVLIGLLGLAGLQTRALTSQMEAYQRSQAISLLKDMSDRIDANRINYSSYASAASATTVGTGGYTVIAASGTQAATDLTEWHNALLGSAETQSGSSVGAMIGARGCITQITTASNVVATLRISVAWQGLNSTVAPSDTCGQNQYGTDDTKRRVISIPVNIANLN